MNFAEDKDEISLVVFSKYKAGYTILCEIKQKDCLCSWLPQQEYISFSGVVELTLKSIN